MTERVNIRIVHITSLVVIHFSETGNICPVLKSMYAIVKFGTDTDIVLGSLFFLVYVNDLSSVTQALSSKVNLFADDVLLYHSITNAHDYVILRTGGNNST